VVQWGDAGGVNQQFRLADSSDGYVRLINRNSGKAVEVQDASTADGAKVVQFTDWGGANQQWQLIRATGVPAQMHTAGRVKDAGNTVQYSWPGVYFVSGDVWQNPGTWRPRLVVVNLGTNDFSTAVNPGGPWTADSLAAAYHDFLQKLRTHYGAATTIVAVGTGRFAGQVQQLVKTRNDARDSGTRYWFLDSSDLDFLGCHWHYSAHDDRVIPERLTSFVAGLPMSW
ncbi:RICIN domain-containing protein, partial [Streptomyces azureus]